MLDLLANHTLAIGVALAHVALRPLTRHFDLQPDEDERSMWVNRHKARPAWQRYPIRGTLIAFNALLTEWYVYEVAVPHLTDTWPAQVKFLVFAGIGVGLGLSVGKALTERNYTWYDNG